MKKIKIFIVMSVLLLLNSSISLIFSQSNVAHTVRCKDGVVLILGTPSGIIKTKEYLQNIKEKNITVKYLTQKLREENIEGINKIEEYYDKSKENLFQKKHIVLTLKEAIDNGLIPDISHLDLQSAILLLETYGFEVLPEGKKIGKTNIYPPVDIIVQSAGCEVGNFAHIYIDGIDYSKNQRGYNIVVVNQNTGKVEASENFDTRAEPGGIENSQKMKKFLENIQEGRIVICAVRDEASKYLTYDTFLQLTSIGGKIQLKRRKNNRFSHAIIGIKGIEKGNAEEDFGFKKIELVALKDRKNEKENYIIQGKKFILLPLDLMYNSRVEIFK